MAPRILGPTGEPWTADETVRDPTDEDVARYVRLRKAGRELNCRLTATVPRRAMADIARALGIVHDGVFVFDSADMTDVFMDCCLYDWIEDGRNLVQKFAEEDPRVEASAGREVLDAMLGARYTVFIVDEAVPGKGVRAHDLMSEEDFFLLDLGLGLTPDIERAMLASRVMPIREHWMTSGAALPLDEAAWEGFASALLRQVLPVSAHEFFDSPAAVLALIRSCLETGVADRVRFRSPLEAVPEEPDEREEPEFVPRAASHRPPRNAPCPCGSGHKYKRCCGRKGRARRTA